MGAPDLIFELRRNGYSIIAEDTFLDISPADDLSSELVQQLKQCKVEILCALHREEELRRLVFIVSKHYGFTEEEHTEVLEVALGDQVNALTCFSALAHKAGLLSSKKEL